MVDAIVSMVLDQLRSFAKEEIQKEVRMLGGVTDEVRNLTRTFKTIQCVLRNADEKQIQDDGVKAWLDNLKEVSYQIEDVLDLWNTKLLSSKIKTSLGEKKVSSNFLNSCFCFIISICIRHNVGREIKGIRKELEDIVDERKAFNLIEGTVVTEIPRLSERDTSSVVNLSEVYGRDVDRDIISSKLVGESSREKTGVHVIAIVAVGGLGKTTLAQKISHEVKNKFEKNAWVCVSEVFEKEKIAKAIIEAFRGNVPTNNNWNTLHNLLTDTVKDKLFMLVLDDVWTENIKDWEPFKLSLEGGAPGSRILVTTRKEAVATMMRSSYNHHLKVLDEKNSWSLFCLAASLREGNGNYERFEPYGKEIMRKCKGVPLYLKTMGSLMSYKTSLEAWEDAMRSEIWETPELEDGVLPALLLSYYDLPSQVKPCFTYCAIYPKDYKMEKEELIKLWMAQGFLYSDTGKALEKVGEGYFDTLVRRSLFQDLEIDCDRGMVTHCKMHDLVHDLVQFLMKNETCVVNDIKDVKTSKIRHLTAWGLKDITSSSFQAMIPSAKDLRSLNLRFKSCPNLDDSFFLHLKCVRSLNLSGDRLDKLSSGVGELIHLRYLDLSETSIKKLPESLCDLCNLQTLRLYSCKEFGELPASMGKMISLRHLYLFYTRITVLPESLCDLYNLQTLDILHCQELSELPISMGKMKSLRIIDLSWNHLTKLPESICDLSNLQTLKLEHSWNLSELPINMGKMKSLRVLDLSHSFLTKLPESVCDLSNLQTLNLFYCRNLSELPISVGKMKNLRCLMLKGAHNIRYLPRGIGKLTSLQVSGLEELDVSGENDTCTLGELKDLNITSELLEITGLWKVDLASEAKRAVLAKSRDIRTLELNFKLPQGSQQSEDDTEQMEGVMECLQPHPNLERLMIWNYIGSKLPRWMSSDFMSTWKLTELTIYNAPELKTLPAFGKFKSLEKLYLIGLDALERIGADFWGISDGDVNQRVSGESITVFPKLEHLTLYKMNKLEEWETTKACWREDATFIMPCLEKLVISYCNNLKRFPFHPNNIPKLKKFETNDYWFYKLQWDDQSTQAHLQSIGKIHEGEGEIRCDNCKKDIIAEICLGGVEFPNLDTCVECFFVELGESTSSQVSNLEILDVSGENGSCTLGELKDLNIKSNYIEITGLWKVDLASETKNQVLAKRRDIKRLVLNFELPEGSQWSEDDIERMEGVMECLQPHPNLEGLRIKGYIGSKLPSWMSSDFMSTWKLRELSMVDAPNLKTLPAFGKLKSLEYIELWEFDSLKHIGPDFLGISDGDVNQGMSEESITVFPKLENLILYKMKKLEEWETTKAYWREDATFIMPCLEKLVLLNCNNLKRFPFHPNNIPKLKKFEANGYWFYRLQWDDQSTQAHLQSIGKILEGEIVCDYCNKDITKEICIWCKECPNFDLCIECFSVGAEVLSHKRNHPYRVLDNLSGPLISPNWNADEEALLLKEIELHGLGNWAEVAQHVSTKSLVECIDHYPTAKLKIGQSIDPTLARPH